MHLQRSVVAAVFWGLYVPTWAVNGWRFVCRVGPGSVEKQLLKFTLDICRSG